MHTWLSTSLALLLRGVGCAAYNESTILIKNFISHQNLATDLGRVDLGPMLWFCKYFVRKGQKYWPLFARNRALKYSKSVFKKIAILFGDKSSQSPKLVIVHNIGPDHRNQNFAFGTYIWLQACLHKQWNLVAPCRAISARHTDRNDSILVARRRHTRKIAVRVNRSLECGCLAGWIHLSFGQGCQIFLGTWYQNRKKCTN
jgi:hypothetical protein